MIDAIGILSVAVIGIACFQIYEPLGLLVPGIIIFTICCFIASKQGQQEKPKDLK